MNIALIICGLIGIAVAIWGKKFHSADVESGSFDNEKESSTWSGKLVFGAVGIGLVLIGILRLIGHD